MAINTDSADLINHQGLADVKIASATDRHVGQLRHEVNLQANNEARVAWEQNMRQEAHMEIGRAQNISRVV